MGDVSISTDKPKLTVKQSRDGYICFLTTINVATQQLWTHLIKNKDPPTLYIDTFLKQHGMQKMDPYKAIITTSGQGYLAKSKAFEATIDNLEYNIQKAHSDYFTDLLSDLLSDQVNATITTNGGGDIPDPII